MKESDNMSKYTPEILPERLLLFLQFTLILHNIDLNFLFLFFFLVQGIDNRVEYTIASGDKSGKEIFPLKKTLFKPTTLIMTDERVGISAEARS